MSGRRTVYTMLVGDWAPEISALTLPLMQRWAAKVGAEFVVIRERRYPDLPLMCEKFQIRELGRERNDEWSFYLDADAVIHPNTPDLFTHLQKDTVYHGALDCASFRYDVRAPYFRRDGRYRSPGNWCTIASEWCRDDLWLLPPAEQIPEIIRGITLTPSEIALGMKAEHLTDDYLTAINEARFGLKRSTLEVELASLGLHIGMCFWHQYLLTREQKAYGIGRALVRDWRLLPFDPNTHPSEFDPTLLPEQA